MRKTLMAVTLAAAALVGFAPAAGAASINDVATPAAATSSSVAVAPLAASACGTSSVYSMAPYSSANGRYQGLLELRYNSCSRTIWARISTALSSGCLPGEDFCATASVHRNSDGAEQSCTTAAGSTSCYTAALNDANVTSYADGWIDVGAYSYYGQTRSF